MELRIRDVSKSYSNGVQLLFVALGPAIKAATIWMYEILADDVLVTGDFGLLGWVIHAYLTLTILDDLVSFCDEYLASWVDESFLVSLRTGLFRHSNAGPNPSAHNGVFRTPSQRWWTPASSPTRPSARRWKT